MVFYETMQERVASILAELDVRAEPALCGTLWLRPGKYLLACGFCKRRLCGKFNSHRGLTFKFKFRPCGSTFKFHHHGRYRLNFAAMRVWH